MHNRKQSYPISNKSKSKFGRIIVVTGARQTGKTTLVKSVFKNFKYISIEDPITVEDYKKLSASQWGNLYPRAILDEIQKEPQLIESIKAVYDQFDDSQYILLGSSQIMLLKKVKESLAGRCLIFELFPLTLPELLTNSWGDDVIESYFQKILSQKEVGDLVSILLDENYSNKTRVYDYYLKFGGYPAITDNSLSTSDRYDWLRNYVQTYFERDIRDLAEIRNLEPFTKTQKLLAINTAQLTNYSQIAADAGVSSKTVQRFLEYSNISYQTITLQAWARNSKKRLVKSPKVHFTDVGVLRTILNKKDDLNGHEFESAMIAEIYKQAKNLNLNNSFYHLRTSDRREIDLLIETEKGYIAIEIKKTENIRAVDARHFKNLEYLLDKPIIHKYILSNDTEIKYLNYGVVAMPAVQFLT
ncbi:MAG: ATP-binding protein [Bacteroidota bacterium]